MAISYNWIDYLSDIVVDLHRTLCSGWDYDFLRDMYPDMCNWLVYGVCLLPRCKMKYLEILEEWEANPKKWSGLCQAVGTDKLELFLPTGENRWEYGGGTAWGRSKELFGLNDFRRNVLIFLAVWNKEL